MRPVVLLDANALFLPFRAGLDLASEVERHRPGALLAVPTSVLRELDRLAGRRAPYATAARALAATLRSVPSAGEGDPAVLRTAVRTGAWVLTADRSLARQLLARGVPVLVPRDRTRLELRRNRPARSASADRLGRGATRSRNG